MDIQEFFFHFLAMPFNQILKPWEIEELKSRHFN